MMNLAISKKKFIRGTFATDVRCGAMDAGPGVINFYKFGAQYFFNNFDQMIKPKPKSRVYYCFAKKR